MDSAFYLYCLLALFIVLLIQDRQKKFIALRKVIYNRKKGRTVMTDMINAYIGKDCLIYTMNSQVGGVIKEVGDGWLSVDTGKGCDVINLDFVVRVREYPKNKKGQRVSIVTD